MKFPVCFSAVVLWAAGVMGVWFGSGSRLCLSFLFFFFLRQTTEGATYRRCNRGPAAHLIRGFSRPCRKGSRLRWWRLLSFTSALPSSSSASAMRPARSPTRQSG
ncbi:hypothetical protein LY76DRAFT_110617 [Colletotrichum caudatum]|nr:hypothetical protein LY76DRAFT_110617 [Colletotrichum caudatum]